MTIKVEVVGNDVPLTGPSEWRLFSPLANRYSARPDPAVQHNGHPTVCLQCQSTPRFGWGLCEYLIYHPDPKFLGHRIRLSIWLKSSGVTGGSGPLLQTFGPFVAQLTNEGQRGHRPITGTHDWTEYTAFADCPSQAKTIFYAVTMNGRGKIWIDTDSVRLIWPTTTPARKLFRGIHHCGLSSVLRPSSSEYFGKNPVELNIAASATKTDGFSGVGAAF